MENLSIVKLNGYKTVISNKHFPKGFPIHHVCCKESPIPTLHTITLDIGYYVVDSLASEINHSFNPNVGLSGDSLISLEEIFIGDEIKRNYYDTEEIILKPFTDRETGELINTKNLYIYKNGIEEEEFLDYIEFEN